MPDFTRHQQLLIYLRQTFCDGNAADLARRIGKDGTYVNRLFYPAGKKGGKGVGPEIMTACTDTFSLQRGFWESDPSEWSESRRPVIDGAISTPAQTPTATVHTRLITDNGRNSFYGWPFGDRILPWEYNMLDIVEKDDIERHIRALIRAKDPPLEHSAPANTERNGTNL